MLMLVTTAAAYTITPSFPQGMPAVGQTVLLEVCITDNGNLLAGMEPTVEAETGTVVAPLGEVTPGRWRYVYRPDTAPEQLSIQLGSDATSWSFQPLEPVQPTVVLSGPQTARLASRPSWLFSLDSERRSTVASLDVHVSEGTVRPAQDGSERLEWSPSNSAYPRVAVLGVRDPLRRGPPRWHTVALRTPLTLPIDTSPGAAVRVTVGDTEHGPFVADAEGHLEPTFDVSPGNSVATVVAEDTQGNAQRSTFALGGLGRPMLVGMVEGKRHPDLPPPSIHLFALDEHGVPWSQMDALRCQDNLGQPLLATAQDDGQWLVAAPQAPLQADQTVACELLNKAFGQWTIPIAELPPEQLLIQQTPEDISADHPFAQLSVYGENARGERVHPSQIQLRALRGTVTVEPSSTFLKATYDGRNAVAYGSDVLQASWMRDAGQAPPWELLLSASSNDAVLRVAGLVLDGQGNAVQGIDVALRTRTAEIVVTTDETGWAEAEFPAVEDAVRITAQTADIQRQQVVVRGEQIDSATRGPLAAARKSLSLTPSLVRGLYLVASPQIIEANTGLSRIEMRPIDRNGQPVFDADLNLHAAQGRFSMIEPEPNGSYHAQYYPPQGVDAATVEITAETADGAYSASTDVFIRPQVYRHMLSISEGAFWTQHSSAARLWSQVRYARQLAPLRFAVSGNVYSVWWHAEAGAVRLAFDGVDGEDTITLRSLFNTGGLGASVRRQQRRFTLWFGGSALPNVSWTSARINNKEVLRGAQFNLQNPVGGHAFAGLGLQTRAGEWQFQCTALALPEQVTDIGWQGVITGVSVSGGYAFLF